MFDSGLKFVFLAISPASKRASTEKQAQVFGFVAETSLNELEQVAFFSSLAIPLATAAISCLNTFLSNW